MKAENSKEERITVMFEDERIRIEKIESFGVCSPKDFWYDQAEEEWVLLMQGSARLMFDTGETLTLRDGQSFTIPAHVKHRVDETSADAVWMCVFEKDPTSST